VSLNFLGSPGRPLGRKEGRKDRLPRLTRVSAHEKKKKKKGTRRLRTSLKASCCTEKRKGGKRPRKSDRVPKKGRKEFSAQLEREKGEKRGTSTDPLSQKTQ